MVGERELRRKITADGAGAVDRDLHRCAYR
jgi:hypothetical protein